MRYLSTRGCEGYKTFEEVIFSGFAEDGGLFMPESIPKITHETLKNWKHLSYQAIVEEIITYFVTEEEIPRNILKEMLSNAFSRFDAKDVVPIASFHDLNIAELWHGPSLSFKDLAMSCVGEFCSYFLSKQKKHVTAIIVTSGDTGSSAIEAIRGKEGVDIIVIFPYKRISEIQELMMTTALDDNVHVYAGEGVSDDFDITMKSLFMDSEFSRKHNLFTINSINWGRIMVQIAHHVYMYLKTADMLGAPVDIVIPTGGCGNIASGLIAQAMGLPANFVCVTNENDIVHRILSSNDLAISAQVKRTLACSMDIQMPPNFERVLWLYSERNSKLCKDIMSQFEQNGKASIPSDLHAKLSRIRSAVATDEQILAAQKRCYDENQYMACPHTSSALAYCYGMSLHGSRNASGTKKSNGELVPVVIAATASIDKFPETLKDSGIKCYEVPARIKDIYQKPSQYSKLAKGEDWENILRTKIEHISLAVSANA